MPNNASVYYDAPPPWMQGGYAAPAHGGYAAPMQMPGGFQAPVGVELGAPASCGRRGGKCGGKRGGRGGGAPQTATIVMPGGARFVMPINQGGAQQQQQHHQTRAQQAHEHWNVVKRLAKLNDMSDAELTDSKQAGKILDHIVSQPRIKLAGIDQLRVILSRYITKKEWTSMPFTEVQAHVLDSQDFNDGHWTPHQQATAGDNGDTGKKSRKFLKNVRPIVERALRAAKRHAKHEAAAGAASAASAVPHPDPGPPAAARFTSMRFP